MKEFYLEDELYLRAIKPTIFVKVKIIEKEDVGYGRKVYTIVPLNGLGRARVEADSLFTGKELKIEK